jgi:hypothetical protein
MAEMLSNLIRHMPFLENYDLILEEGQAFFRHKTKYEDEKYSVINVSHLLYMDERYFEEIFTLFSMEQLEEGHNKSVQARYISGGTYNALNFRVSSQDAPEEDRGGAEWKEYDAEDFFYEVTGLSWDHQEDDPAKKNDDYIISHIHAINYKYIKNLALAISDSMVLIHGSREVLYDLFGKSYSDIFVRVKDAGSVDDPSIDWDGIIVMLLIEASPSKVLQTLIENNEQMFYYIVANLCKRIDNPEAPICNLSGTGLKNKVTEIIKKKLIIGEASGFGRLKSNDVSKRNKRLFARAAAILIISSLSAIEDDNRIICAGNIYDNEALLKSIMMDGTNEQKKNSACIVLGETFKHLLCFYRGAIAYGRAKATFDADHYDTVAAPKVIQEHQNSLNNAFLTEAKKEKEALKGYDFSRPKDIAELI